MQWHAHIATGEVAALKHEIRNDTVKLRVPVAKALLASTQGPKVFSGLGYNIIVEIEVDAALLCYRMQSMAVQT